VRITACQHNKQSSAISFDLGYLMSFGAKPASRRIPIFHTERLGATRELPLRCTGYLQYLHLSIDGLFLSLCRRPVVPLSSLPPVLPRPPRPPPFSCLLHSTCSTSSTSGAYTSLHLLHLSFLQSASSITYLYTPIHLVHPTSATTLHSTPELQLPQTVCWAYKQWEAASLSTPSMSTAIWTRMPTC
jgi:hypothetical protein